MKTIGGTSIWSSKREREESTSATFNAVGRDFDKAKFGKHFGVRDRLRALLRLDKFRKADPIGYANYFFAEAIDSYYCSDESRAKFQETYKKTWKRFTNEKKANSPVKLFGVR